MAAGLGTRMKSKLSKVMHPIGGMPMIWWVTQAVSEATGSIPHVIIGPDDQSVKDFLGENASFVLQPERLGTAHAVLQATESLQGKSDFVLVINGDMPLLEVETIKSMIAVQKDNSGVVTILTGSPSISRGFGRVMRDRDGEVLEIIEEAHASADQLASSEVNVGAYCFQSTWLWEQLPLLPPSPKGEFYITDMIGKAVDTGERIGWVEIQDEDEIIGINTRGHLAEAQSAIRRRINDRLMESGVSIFDPAATYIDVNVKIGRDSTIMPNTYLQGNTVIGEGCEIGPNSILQDSSVGDRCKILMSVLTQGELENDVHVGPFARIRPGAYLCDGVHVGNFGEIKRSRLGPGVKLGHFSYIGDTTIGENSNIGAGTITCNFDGESKHETIIGKDVFIGSDTMLVAPLTLGDGSRTGAGSVVTKDVPENTLVAGVPARAIRKLDKSDN
jgi:bifunctional UDP-N-acetylglucosamine pyrophosphorylase/glucosamine-1-phosphate N-acetyltransferase